MRIYLIVQKLLDLTEKKENRLIFEKLVLIYSEWEKLNPEITKKMFLYQNPSPSAICIS